MKKYIYTTLVFLVGAALGLTVGWRSGFSDGFFHSRIALTSWIPKTRSISQDPAVNEQLDILAASTAGVFGSSMGFSPFMAFTKPKAESGFMDMVAYQELHASELPTDHFFTIASYQAPGALNRTDPESLRDLKEKLIMKYPNILEAAKARQTQRK